MVGREGPHHFGWVSKQFGAVYLDSQNRRSRNRPDLKTKQSHLQTYLMLDFVLLERNVMPVCAKHSMQEADALERIVPQTWCIAHADADGHGARA